MSSTHEPTLQGKQHSSTQVPVALRPIAAAIMALSSFGAEAATVSWNSPNFGYWDVAGFWTAPPSNGDTVLTGSANTGFRQGTLDIASLTGTGKLTMDGGTLRIAGASSIGSVDMTASSAVLSGAGALTVGTLNFNTGTLGESGHGGGSINSSHTTFDTSLGFSLNVNTTLNLNGGATWGASSSGTIGINSGNYGGQINIAAGTTFSDAGTLTSTQYRYLGATSQGLIVNSGTYTRSGLGTTYVQAQLTNNGVVNVNGGTLLLSGTYGGYGGGTWNVASGATLAFANGSSSLYGAIVNNGTIASSGNVSLSLGSYSGNGSIAVTNGTFTTTGSSATMAPASMTLSNGVAHIGSTVNVGALSLTGGYLSGTGTVTAGTLYFGTGSMGESSYGGGTTTVTGGATFDGTAQQYVLAGRTLNLNGATTWTASTSALGLAGDRTINISGAGSNVVVGSGATFADQGSTIAGLVRNLGTVGAGNGTFTNQGTYTRTGLGTTVVNSAFNNNGVLNVNGGAMSIAGGGSSSGQWNIASGATLNFTGGTSDVHGGTLNNAGAVAVTSGTVSVSGGGTSTGAISTATGGTLNISGGTYAVTGGTLADAGTLRVSGGILSVASAVGFSGAGTVAVTAGQLNSSAYANFAGGSMNVSGGTANLANGGSFGSLSISGGSMVQQYVSGSLGAGNVMVGSFNFTGGSMLNSQAVGLQTIVTGAATFGFGSETLSNGQQLTLNGASTWLAGNGATIAIIGGSGAQAQLNVGAGGTFADLGGGNRTLGGDGFSYVNNGGIYTRTGSGTTTATNSFTNYGTLNINGGTMAFATGYGAPHSSTGTIDIASGATMQDDSAFAFKAGALNNQGQLKVTAGTTTLAAGVAYGGAGSINVTGGALASAITGAITTGGIALTGGTASFTGAVNAASLALAGGTLTAASNITVATDYTNTGSGSGNGFDKRAGISGIGSINGTNVAEAITGAHVTNGTTGNATLTIGNVRVGVANRYAYQVANAGTGSTLRGAIQTTGIGIGVNDARLTGTGVTAANFGPLAAGANSGDLAVGFTASTAGALTLNGVNTIHVANNFGNVAEQNLAIVAGVGAAAYNAASGSASASLGNVRVGAALSGGITVTNTAASGAYSEDLNATLGTTQGSVTASGSLSGLVAGASNSSALIASLDSTTAGAKSGSVTIAYTTAGKVAGTSNGLGTLDVGGQVVAVSGGVYNAAVGSITGTPVLIANQRVGGNGTSALNVSNVAASGPYSEALDANVAGVTGSVGAGGSLANLAAGVTNGSALSVGVNTGTAGYKTGNVTIGFQTDGTGSNGNSGLAAIAAGSQTVAVSGGVYNTAVGSIAPSTIVVANQRVGGNGTSALSVSNTAASGAYSEALNASFASVTGGAMTNGGSVSNLVAGGSNGTSLGVRVATGTAGFKTGNVVIGFQTDGTGSNGNSGLAAIAAGSQTVAVSGAVYNAAVGSIAPTAIVIANQRVSGNVTSALNVSNNAANGAYSEALNANVSGVTGGATAAGSLSNLVAGGSNGSALTVGVSTATAGLKTGSVTVGYQTDGTGSNGNSGLAAINAGSQTIGVSGAVYDTAVGSIASTPVVIANQRVGGSGTSAVIVANTAATGGYGEALNATVGGVTGGATATGSLSNLAAGASNGSALSVGVNTASAGFKSGVVTVGYQSDGTGSNGNSGLAAIAAGSQTVDVSGAVYRLANPTLTTGSVTAVGRVGGQAQTAAIGVVNGSPDVYTEGLTVTRGATAAGFTASGSVTNLVAGGSSHAIGVTLDTSTAGTFGGTQVLGYVSTGAGTTGAADLAIGSGSVTLNGKVYATAVASVTTPAIDFGIVHVGDTVSRGVSVTNAAAGALTDVLTGSANGASAPFTAAGNLGAGLGAGQSSSALKVGLDTSKAGVYSGTAAFSMASHDADLSDVALADLAIGLSGTVDAYASETLALQSGAGTLTRVGSTWYLDYGTVVRGSGARDTTLVAGNDASGPADLLDGSFEFLDAADFGESGFGGFADVGAGRYGGPLTFAFDALALGDFEDTIALHGVGHNASGYTGALDDLRLVVRGAVVAADVTDPTAVPEPDAWMLMAAGLPLLVLRRIRRSIATSRASLRTSPRTSPKGGAINLNAGS